MTNKMLQIAVMNSNNLSPPFSRGCQELEAFLQAKQQVAIRNITYYNWNTEGKRMTEREILKLMMENGWMIEEGKKHHLATHPNKPGVKIPVPRHRKDIPLGTLMNILKAAGLKLN